MNNTTNNNNKRRHHNHNGNTINNNSNYNKNRNRQQRFQPERPSINKVYDSNGPSGRQRGNASTLYEKYSTLARDANSSGDRVLSENFMQYAEHYLRIVNSIQEQIQSIYREEYREAQQNSEEQANNHDTQSYVTSSQEQNYEADTHNSKDNNPRLTSEKSELLSADDAAIDKPIMRRKSYPYARRKPYDPLQGRHQPETGTDAQSSELSQDTHTHTHTQKSELPIESLDSEKPRRVIRRRSVVKDVIHNETDDTKNV